MRGRALRVRVRKRATESNRHVCEGGGEGGMRRSKGEVETYSQERERGKLTYSYSIC